MDGASSQQNFKQKWFINNNKDATYLTDSTIFVISYVPLISCYLIIISYGKTIDHHLSDIVDLSNLNFLKRHYQMFCVNIIFM